MEPTTRAPMPRLALKGHPEIQIRAIVNGEVPPDGQWLLAAVPRAEWDLLPPDA